MNKPTLISVAFAAVISASGLMLPTTASASSYTQANVRVVYDSGQGGYLRPVHGSNYRYIESYRHHDHNHRAQSHDYCDHGRHSGHRHKRERHYDYRPVERSRRHDHDNDLRVRILYDFHL